MKLHLTYSLTVLLGLVYHLSRAQSHELVFKAGPASYNSSHGPVSYTHLDVYKRQARITG